MGDLEILLDKQAIYETVLRYCRVIDRLDMELVRSAYHPDGIDNHAGFSGPVEDFIAWVEPALREYHGTHQFVGNHMVEVAGDEAVSETYLTAVHWGPDEDGSRRNFTVGSRYVDHMTRRDGRWAIQERWAVREWTKSDVGLYIPSWARGPTGERGPGDALMRLRAKLGLPISANPET